MVRTESGRRELVHPGRQGGPARVGSVPQSVASAPGFGVQARPDRTAVGPLTQGGVGSCLGLGSLGSVSRPHGPALATSVVERASAVPGAPSSVQAPKFRLREGAPGRREYQRGGLPNLDAEDARVQALELFDVDVLASTSRSAENSRTVQNSR